MKSTDPAEVLRYYVYTLAYPESMGGKVFYVGKGTKGRFKRHLTEVRSGVISPKCDAIRSILASGESVVMTKVKEHLTSSAAFNLERDLISQYGYENLTNRPLERARKESIFPRVVTVSSSLKKEVEDDIRACMEAEGIPLTERNCCLYIQNILADALYVKAGEKDGTRKAM